MLLLQCLSLLCDEIGHRQCLPKHSAYAEIVLRARSDHTHFEFVANTADRYREGEREREREGGKEGERERGRERGREGGRGGGRDRERERER